MAQAYPSIFAHLPTELLRDILELTASCERTAALKLALVSSWVRHWIEPVLFHTVALYSARSLKSFVFALSSKPTSFPSTHVKFLGIFALGPVQSIELILNACRGVNSLACGFSLPVSKEPQGCDSFQRFRSLKEQHLLGLSCRDSWNTALVGPSVTHLRLHLSPFLGTIFPLALSPSEDNEAGWEGLARLTSLTHLAIVYRPPQSSSVTAILPRLQRLLYPTRGIEVPRIHLILIQVVESPLSNPSAVIQLNEAVARAGSPLLRIVAERAPSSPMVQWERASGEGRTIWNDAEEVLAARQANLSSV